MIKRDDELVEVINNSLYLSSIYSEVYQAFHVLSGSASDLRVLEIGSGGLDFARKRWPNVLNTRFDTDGGILAEELPFENNSFDLIIAKDVLHHIKDVPRAFSEFNRVLVSGGKVIASEPSWSLLGRIIYRYFHEEDWQESKDFVIKSNDPWASNQALIYNLTKLSSDERSEILSGFELTTHGCTYGITYLISGGVHTPILFLHKLLNYIHSCSLSRSLREMLVDITSMNRLVVFTNK